MEISYAVYFIVVALITGFSLGTIYELQRNDRQREKDRRRVAREAEEQKLRDLRLELDQAKRDIRLLQREKGSQGSYVSL